MVVAWPVPSADASALRPHAAKPLPGKTIAILDPQTKLVVDVILCVDGHAQERSKFNQVLAQVQPQEVWIADRNFCTAGFLHTIDQLGAFERDSSTRGFRMRACE